MEEILLKLGYQQHVIDKFAVEGVTPEAVTVMSGEQIGRLGIEGMGRQAILISRCRASLLSSQEASSGVGGSASRLVAAQRETSRLFRPLSMPRAERKRKRTVTLTVLCLAQPYAKTIPSNFHQQILKAAALGEKKLTIPADTTPSELQERLLAEYPKLKDGGGYEYLRSVAPHKTLEVIPIPNGGFSASNLKSVVKQARIYLRPIQSELDVFDNPADESNEDDELMLKCNSCGKMIAQTKLKSHVALCNGQPQSSTDTPLSTSATQDELEILPNPFEDVVVIEVPEETECATRNQGTSVPSSSHQVSAERAHASINYHFPTSSGVADSCLRDYIDLLEPGSPAPSEPADFLDDEIQFVLSKSLRELDDEKDDVVLKARMQSKLTLFQGIREQDSVDLVIRRKRLLKCATDVITKQIGFSFYKNPMIHFSGEDAVDMGGPKREFFRLLMQQLASISIFEGTPGRLYFSHDIDLLEMGKYKLAGQMIAWSVLHGGPGFPVLNTGLYDLMVGVVSGHDVQLKMTDITDADVLGHLNTIQSASSASMIAAAVEDVGEWAANSGYSRIYSLTLESKEQTIQALVKQHIFYRCKAELDQFQLGMDSVGGFWRMITEDPDAFRTLLTPTNQKLTFSDVKNLFKPIYSEETHHKDDEDDTVFSWEKFLQKCDAGGYRTEIDTPSGKKTVTTELADVLKFCTAADAIPPLGFDKQIDILFFSVEEGMKGYPTAHTCGLQLNLPRGMDEVDEFAKLMAEAILESPGFGKK